MSIVQRAGHTEDGSHTVPEPRPRAILISARLRKDAKGAVKAAIDMLGVAASVTQSVPYIGVISAILAELLKIQDEVNTFKSECHALLAIVLLIKTVVDRVQEQCVASGKGADELPAGLIEPFEDLEQCIVKVLEVLHACTNTSSRLSSRIRLYLNRTELLANVRQCRIDMQTALDLFNARLHILNTFAIRDQCKKLEGQDLKLDMLLERRKARSSTSNMHPYHLKLEIQVALLEREPPKSRDAQLPPAPSVFHGRIREVQHIVDVILHKAPARIGILGPGGIGKTAISLSALHHVEVDALYGRRRFFLSCEAIYTAESLVQGLLNLFTIDYLDGPQGAGSPLDVLLSHMRTTLDGTLLCLDNLETPWDADTHAIETLLSNITALPHVALLITTRGASRPRGVSWTQPFLPQVEPLTSESALAVWDAICETHDDFSLKLVRAVDHVPLAVTILAHLAESESSHALWTRWEQEQTELLRIHGPTHRLSNVDISVQLSLNSPRLRGDKELLEFFGVLCILPQGMLESRISTFVGAYKDQLPNMRRSITLLKQCSLAYPSRDGYLRVLSPVRHYVQTYHPVSSKLFLRASEMYRAWVDCEFSDFGTRSSYAREKLQPELSNISAVLRRSLRDEACHVDSTLRAILNFSRLSQILFVFDAPILSEAIDCARRNVLLQSEANLLLEKGKTHFFQFQRDDALSVLLEARPLYQRLQDKAGEAECLQATGDVLRLLDRIREAISTFQLALSLFVEIGYRRGQASTLTRLGELQVRSGLLDEAEHSLRSALQLYSNETGVRLGEANAMRHLGGLYVRLGRVDDAENALRSALRLYDAINATLGRANTWLIMAKWYLQLERFREAESAAQHALDIYLDIGGRIGEAHVLNCVGRLYTRTNRLAEAERTLQSALALYQALGNRLEEVNVMNLLGFVYRRLGRWEEADTILRSSADICQRDAFVLALGTSHRYLGLLQRDRGFLTEAKASFEQALRHYENGHHPESVARALRDLSSFDALDRDDSLGASLVDFPDISLSDPETASIRVEHPLPAAQFLVSRDVFHSAE
ncbi:unnamed protein product [Peniophora sp. CBMAI 1063]|nr:unnamed protein product [Peniophora sp. CBMAI 1063]